MWLTSNVGYDIPETVPRFWNQASTFWNRSQVSGTRPSYLEITQESTVCKQTDVGSELKGIILWHDQRKGENQVTGFRSHNYHLS